MGVAAKTSGDTRSISKNKTSSKLSSTQTISLAAAARNGDVAQFASEATSKGTASFIVDPERQVVAERAFMQLLQNCK